MTPLEYSRWREEGTKHFLLDVRQPEEYKVARILGATLIPLGELAPRVSEIPKDAPVIVYCHHGVRSAHAVQMLRAEGWDARNLSGGIEAWSLEIDRKVPRY